MLMLSSKQALLQLSAHGVNCFQPYITSQTICVFGAFYTVGLAHQEGHLACKKSSTISEGFSREACEDSA